MQESRGSMGATRNTYCEIPWIGLTLDSKGRPQICCEAGRGEDLNASSSSIDEMRNSPDFREVRRELLAGGQPALCRKCWDDEKVGITSLRQARGHGLL